MKKSLILLGILSLLFFECNKSNFNDLAGVNTVNGVVVLYDTLMGNYSYTSIGSIQVYLKNTADTNGYLYSTTTNSAGQYVFNGIDPNISYTIYATKDSNNIKYYGKIVYGPDSITNYQSDTLKLYASQTNQNGIHLIVYDNTGERLPNVTAWVFNNASLFSASDSTGKIFNMTTNNFGVDNKLNIAPGKYYLRIKTKIGNIELKGETNVEVTEQGIKNAVVTLNFNQNGFELLILDNNKTIVSNAEIYTYRSRSVFLDDSTYTNSIAILKSDSIGKASQYNIDQGRYYLRIKKQVGSFTYTSLDSVDVIPNAITKKTIELQQPTNKNGFKLTTLDNYGSPVDNADIYTYRSRSVFLIDTTYQNSSFILKSDNNGNASKYNIDQGWYYFRVIRQIDSTTLKGIDSVNVPSNMIVVETIEIKK